MAVRAILEGYAAASAELIAPFEAISSDELYRPVAELLPPQPCRVLDVGAGTGRDAAWLAAQGHQVLAVEPVAELRAAGVALHADPNIVWLDDRLPGLAEAGAWGPVFRLVLLSGVWQHLEPLERPLALRTLAAVTAPGGRLILSLRHGPGALGRACFEADPDGTIADAEAVGLRLLLRRSALSIQPANRAAGVTWTWLGFEKD
jgi:SAM-dependent methyltransferase